MEQRVHTRLTPVEHVLKRPGTWIGSVSSHPRTQFVHNLTSDDLVKRRVEIVDAYERMFIEALSNATDCIQFSRRNNHSLGDGIQVTITDTTITVRNGGLPMPIQFNDRENMWQPEMICGVLFVSSNFGDNRQDAGLNGLGIKLANIYSLNFSIDIGNATTSKRYRQAWRQNMSFHTQPVIDDTPTLDYTQVSYEADLSRFSFLNSDPAKSNSQSRGIDDDHLSLFVNHCINASFNTEVSVNVVVSTTRHNFSHKYNLTRSKYLSRYLLPSISTSNINCKRIEYTFETATISSIVTIIDCGNNGGHIHFTNGIENRDGGCCVEETLTAVSGAIIKRISDQLKVTTRMNKKDVRDRILLMMSTRCINPEFEGQMKTKLNSPSFAASPPSKCIDAMMSWDSVKALAVSMMQRMQTKVNSSTRIGRRKLRIPEVDDANLAGRRPELCRLCIVEGLSAKNHPSELINNIANGRDIIGIFPLQGKPINTLKHTECEILNNKVFQNLCSTLGLAYGTSYTSTKGLRYGRVDILVDADEDGKHILGLILLFFHTHFPSLLSIPFIYYLRTPIIRATRGDISIPFYSKRRYDKWCDEVGDDSSSYRIEYFKGLSSSSSEQIFSDMANLEYVSIHNDTQTDDYLRLCFDDISSDRRKQWLVNIITDKDVETRTRMGVSYIVHNQVSEHSISNYRRTIPGPDGLKRSQRKVLYTALRYYSNATKPIGIPQLVGKVMDATAYAHGSANVEKIIIAMTQNFVGSNNMPYFQAKGLFGSRIQGGADSGQPRYLGARPQPWLRKIFLKQDDVILEHLTECGDEVEPRFYLPILPMHMINGVDGVGTGWSTQIPPFNPLELCDAIVHILERMIDADTYSPTQYDDIDLIPWYRGFRGRVSVCDKTSRLKTDAVYEYREKENRLIIEELPVGVWSDAYRRKLDEYMIAEEGRPKYVKDYDRHDTTLVSRFDIQLTVDAKTEDLASNFLLSRSTSLSNMYTLNVDRMPIKHSSPVDMLLNFVSFRLPYYTLRKSQVLATMNSSLKSLADKSKLIGYYIDGVIDPRNASTESLLRQCRNHGISEATYNEVRFRDVTVDEVEKLNSAHSTLSAKIAEFEKQDIRRMWIQDIRSFKSWYSANASDFNIFESSTSNAKANRKRQ